MESNQNNFVVQVQFGLKLAYKIMLEKKALQDEDVILTSPNGLPMPVKARQLLRELFLNKK